MARHRNRTTKTHKRANERRKEKQAAEELATAVEDTTSRFTCTTGVAEDFADQCEQRIYDLEFDLVCTRLALEMWGPVPSVTARPVVELLREVLAERERHHQALMQLGQRLDEYAQRDIHEHLEPMEKYAELVFKRLFEPPSDLDVNTGP
jgi:hypothetical protein